jgi:hypothetical protein
MPDTATSPTSTTLLLFPVSWNQTVHTHRTFTMQMEAEASKRGVGRLNVPGLGNILELPFELNLVRGRADWNLPELPAEAVGFLACYENRFDEFGVQRTLVGGAISLPEAVFDDIWERVRLSPDFYSMILITVGPVVRAHATEDRIWDRAKDKFLFFTEAGITFKRVGKEPLTQR